MATRIRLTTICAALFLAPAALAGTRYVNGALTTGANNGTSWADAFRGVDAIQPALTAAVVGDQIWVAQGTYLATTAGTRSATFTLKNGVQILGGFNGTETLATQRNPALNVTTLSGDLAGNDNTAIYTDNSYHVVSGNIGTAASAILDGFTVIGGNANGGGSNEDRGGGILCLSGGSPTIRQCKFTNHRCTFGGGAGYINGSSPSFTDCVFDGNNGSNYGGAFDMANGVGATFERCVFSNNTAARAGGIEIFGSSTVKVHNSLFFGNTSTSTGGGGAIYISGSAPQIRNCTITGNTATANATGGILGASATPTIVNCIVHGNTGSGGSMGIGAQLSAGMGVTYSLVPAAYAGAGNVVGAPVFSACGPSPYRLSVTSPGIDAGNNAGVAAGTTLDLAHGLRIGDSPSVPDSGSGTAPIVDMGAFESSDCNQNGVADWCDLQSGFSLDVNADGIPDDCQCQGGSPAFVYCTAKFNSALCLPAMGFTGYASASNAAPFLLTATNIINQKTGLLFYGYSSNAAPFNGGTLCVHSPIRRTPTQNSGGNPTGVSCTGTFSFDFNAYIQTGVDPLVQVVGQQVNTQYWSRDPQDPFTTNTTDAVQFAVCQ